jgi:hypothetical protein
VGLQGALDLAGRPGEPRRGLTATRNFAGHGGLHQNTAQRSGYESSASRSIGASDRRMIVTARIIPARCGFQRDCAAFYSRSQSESRAGERRRGAGRGVPRDTARRGAEARRSRVLAGEGRHAQRSAIRRSLAGERRHGAAASSPRRATPVLAREGGAAQPSSPGRALPGRGGTPSAPRSGGRSPGRGGAAQPCPRRPGD